MPKMIDLTGEKFGRWTVLQLDKENKKKGAHWICQCECGEKRSVCGQTLRNGRSKSCGCLHKEIVTEIGHNNVIDLTGKTFGKLTVLYKAPHDDNNTSVYWVCQCECGRITQPISGQNLRRGETISCGCVVSRGNDILRKVLSSLNIDFECEKKFQELKDIDYLRFDFFLPKDKIAIEYQGKQHYFPQKPFGGEKQFKKQIEHDNLKRKFCEENQIKLIEIPYWDYDKIDENYLKNLLVM